jgi:TetR/AcrR family transcriptional regulator
MPKPDTKKEKIIAAVLDTIYENSISDTNLRDVAKRADMSQGNMYYYFPTKTELYIALLDHLVEKFAEERREMMEGSYSALEKISFIFEQDKDLILRRKELEVKLDFWLQKKNDPVIHQKIKSMYKIWQSDIKKVIGQSIVDGEFERIVPYLIVSMMEGAALQYIADPNEFDLDEYFSTAIEMIVDLINDKPQPLIHQIENDMSANEVTCP